MMNCSFPVSQDKSSNKTITLGGALFYLYKVKKPAMLLLVSNVSIADVCVICAKHPWTKIKGLYKITNVMYVSAIAINNMKY